MLLTVNRKSRRLRNCNWIQFSFWAITTCSFGFVLLFASVGLGQFLNEQSSVNVNLETHFTRSHFIVPNEELPQDGIPIFQRAPEGAYLSVGTERGFIGSSLAKNTTYLLLVDYDPWVVTYNRLNRALLKLSSSRVDYLALRLSPDHKAWTGHTDINVLTHEEKELLGRRELFEFWKGIMSDPGFFHFNYEGNFKNENRPFHNANYLYDDSLFLRIQRLAKEEKISILHVDLRKNEEIDKTVDSLKSIGLMVSIFDMSNAWMPSQYLPFEKTRYLLEKLKTRTKPESIFLITGHKRQGSGWAYLGITFDNLNPFPKLTLLDSYLRNLERSQFPQDVVNQLNPEKTILEINPDRERGSGSDKRLCKEVFSPDKS